MVLKGDLVVQSFGFSSYLPIGKIDAVIEFFVNWDVDEIIILDIDATRTGSTIRLDLIERVSRKCFVPLTIGGGIRDSDFVTKLLKVGADKICVNAVAIEDPQFISRVADKYGRQFVTVSIDARKTASGYQTFIRNGSVPTGLTPLEHALQAEKNGAGEIFLNSIDRDGFRQGYDIELLKSVSQGVDLPVVACGGVGKAGDLAEAITAGGCQAASAANIFNHTELSTVAGKAIMKRKGIPIRIDSGVKYEDFEFDSLDRPI